jgi:hypothetical protein
MNVGLRCFGKESLEKTVGMPSSPDSCIKEIMQEKNNKIIILIIHVYFNFPSLIRIRFFISY